MPDSNRIIDIMGIANLTDNSYYSESRCLDAQGRTDTKVLLERVGKMIDEGASIIDIGACSTRPGSEAVGEEVEWARLEPALKAVRQSFPEIRISVDTYWSSVVRNTFDTIGDFLVNDISAGEDDSDMLRTVGELGLSYVAMHKRGNPKTMQSLTDYDDVTDDVVRYFEKFSLKAEENGIKDWILDPGFGFAKTIDQNYQMLRQMEKFSSLGKRVLVGVSRKSMLYRLFDSTPEEILPETQVLHLAALCKGADILRVHDVKAAAHTIELYRRIC